MRSEAFLFGGKFVAMGVEVGMPKISAISRRRRTFVKFRPVFDGRISRGMKKEHFKWQVKAPK
jgi:hypothetical protein